MDDKENSSNEPSNREPAVREHSVREHPVRMNYLSPWDMSGLGMGFGLYRPRRPSYTYATQTQRQRSESYRYAVRKSASDLDESPDFIEGVLQRKNRKESYIRATREEDPHDFELRRVSESPEVELAETDANIQSKISVIIECDTKDTNHIVNSVTNAIQHNGKDLTVNNLNCNSDNHIKELKAVVNQRRYSPHPSPYHNKLINKQTANISTGKGLSLDLKGADDDAMEDSVFTSVDPNTDKDPTTPCFEGRKSAFPLTTFQFKKNLILLCASFILLFSAFRAIQNLQSSLNSEDNLGIIAMSCVHGTMFLSCLWAPAIINTFTAKWTISFGMFSFILWIGANFYPRFYTLIPFGIIAGMGQGILWTAESSYLLKLAFDSSRVTKDGLEREVFRFHGIFLACFQTTHIWGNLISSIVLSSAKKEFDLEASQKAPVYYYDLSLNGTFIDYSMLDYSPPEVSSVPCGVLYPCQHKPAKGEYRS